MRDAREGGAETQAALSLLCYVIQSGSARDPGRCPLLARFIQRKGAKDLG